MEQCGLSCHILSSTITTSLGVNGALRISPLTGMMVPMAVPIFLIQ
jgi:hypothetical protein